jgi:hypothetical protein
LLRRSAVQLGPARHPYTLQAAIAAVRSIPRTRLRPSHYPATGRQLRAELRPPSLAHARLARVARETFPIATSLSLQAAISRRACRGLDAHAGILSIVATVGRLAAGAATGRAKRRGGADPGAALANLGGASEHGIITRSGRFTHGRARWSNL